jgi:hypothetical protein
MRIRNASQNSAALLPHIVAVTAVVAPNAGKCVKWICTVFWVLCGRRAGKQVSCIGMYAGRQDACAWRSAFFIQFSIGIKICRLVTTWCRGEKMNVARLLKKFLSSYGTRRFINFYTKSRNCTVCWSSWIEPSLSHSIFSVSVLILSSRLCFGLASGFLWFSKAFCLFLIVPVHATCSNSLNLRDFLTPTSVKKSWVFRYTFLSILLFLPPLLSPDISVSTLFIVTSSPCSSLRPASTFCHRCVR